MLNTFRATRSNILVWILMGLLIIGLAGFGITMGGGLGSRDVARVGDQRISVDDFSRSMSQELNSLSSQLGRSLPMTEARQFGLDRMVLARLVNDAAIDGEAAALGISAGDETVSAQILAAPAFRGIDGNFDRQTYAFALQRLGLTPSAFEEQIRREAARSLVTAGVRASTAMPDTLALTLLGFMGETRGFDWVRLDATLLTEPVTPPTEAELAAWHEANPDRYTRPETQVITYAAVRPSELAAGIEVDEADLRAVYEADTVRFRTPERRILDRIGFASDEAAQAARARLDAGEIDFDALAAERGLSPTEIDQGQVTAAALSADARAAVFEHDGPGIVGPVPTPLGPSLYRINAVLAERVTPFEEARPTLATERALETARAQVNAEMARIDDLIAGGATLEEIATETVMDLGTIELNAETQDGIAGDPAFRQLATGAHVGEETDLAELSDGGLVALRVEAVEPAEVLPLDEIRERVAADWTAARTSEALMALVERERAALTGDAGLADLAGRFSLTVESLPPVGRGVELPGMPPALIDALFAAEPGAILHEADGEGVIVAELTAIEAFDPDAPQSAEILATVGEQFRAQTADDVLGLFVAALRNREGVFVSEELIDTALAQFP